MSIRSKGIAAILSISTVLGGSAITVNAVQDPVISKLLTQLSESRNLRQSITPTINPDAYDAKYEDNDYLDTAYEWGVYSNNRTLSAEINRDNKRFEDGYVRGYDFDFYRVTVTPSSGLNGRVAFKMISAGSYDYDLVLYREDSPTSYTPIDISDNPSGVDEIVRTPSITKNTTYIICVTPKTEADADGRGSYTLTQFNNMARKTYTANFSPSTMRLAANGDMSNVVSVNLANVSSIPNDAVVKSVDIKGSFKPSSAISSGYYLLMNGAEGIPYTNQFFTQSANAHFKELDERVDLPVKTVWSAAYMYQSIQASTISNAQLTIQYYYDWSR